MTHLGTSGDHFWLFVQVWRRGSRTRLVSKFLQAHLGCRLGPKMRCLGPFGRLQGPFWGYILWQFTREFICSGHRLCIWSRTYPRVCIIGVCFVAECLGVLCLWPPISDLATRCVPQIMVRECIGCVRSLQSIPWIHHSIFFEKKSARTFWEVYIDDKVHKFKKCAPPRTF